MKNKKLFSKFIIVFMTMMLMFGVNSFATKYVFYMDNVYGTTINSCVPIPLPSDTFEFHTASIFIGGGTQWKVNGSIVVANCDSMQFVPTTVADFTITAYSLTFGFQRSCVLSLFSGPPAPATFSVNTGNVINATGDTIWNCGGSVIVTANASGSEPFVWYGPSGFTPNSSDNPISGLSIPGVYSFVRPGACDTTTNSFVLLPSVNGSPNLGPPVTTCNDGSATLIDAGPGYTSYHWSTGETTQTISVTTSDTYTVTVTSPCIGTAIASKVVTYETYSLPIASAPDTTACPGNTITISLNNSYTSYEWSDASTASTMVATQDGQYYCIVHQGACSEISNVVTLHFPTVYQDEEICVVTFDVVVNKNIIIWEKPAIASIDSFKVYKEITTNNYSVIGSVPYASVATFTDMSSNPPAYSSTYKISVVDTCGNESDLSSAHTTIQLGLSQGIPPSTMVLDWTEYIGVPVDQYYIYRGHTANTMVLYDSIPGSQSAYNDLNVTNTKFYQIGVSVPGGCNPGAKTIYAGSFSNQVDNDSFVGISHNPFDISLTISPNPSAGQFQVECEGMTSIIVTDIIGNKIFTTDQHTFDLSSFGAGMYNVCVYTKDGSANQKVIVQ